MTNECGEKDELTVGMHERDICRGATCFWLERSRVTTRTRGRQKSHSPGGSVHLPEHVVHLLQQAAPARSLLQAFREVGVATTDRLAARRCRQSWPSLR
jgi:hypothetical protein